MSDISPPVDSDNETRLDSIPVIALVGRPNVGKSTLFNQLTRSRDALVANYAGLTRDRQYGDATYQDRPYMVIDTGGISGDERGIDNAMAAQSLLAIEEADIVVLMLDARAGLSNGDFALAKYLREAGKPFYTVANKVDGMDPNVVMADCYQLGSEFIYPMTASHGKGVKTLLDDIFSTLPPYEAPEDELGEGIRIAVVGRPNVGKSTLVNRMLGEDRVVVYDQPGTTRDSIYIKYERDGEPYTLIDTAGVRRRKNVKETVEKFSIVKTLKAIADANVVVLMMDATENIVDQDLHLLGTVIDAGRALVLAVNKWDGLELDQKNQIKSEIDRRLRFIDFAELHFISAMHGTGVGHLYESIHAAYDSSMEKFQTHRLTEILEHAVADHPPPMINGRRIKLRYAHAGGSNPPIIVVHGNQTDKVPASYKRYLEKLYRHELKLVGTPLRVEFKGSENPFEGKKNKLNQRQIKNKKRLVKFVKKKEKKQKKKR